MANFVQRGVARLRPIMLSVIDPYALGAAVLVVVVFLMVGPDAARRSTGVFAISQSARMMPLRRESMPWVASMVCPEPLDSLVRCCTELVKHDHYSMSQVAY